MECPPNADRHSADYLPYLHNVQSYIPPTLLSTLSATFASTFALLRTLQTLFQPLITRLTTQPDLASVLLLLALLFISFRILDMAYRAFLFWVRLAFQVLLWGSIAGLGLWMYTKGVDGVVEDAQNLGSFFAGQYEKYRLEFEAERMAGGQGPYGAYGGAYGHPMGARGWGR